MSIEKTTALLDEPHVLVFTGAECAAIAASLDITLEMQEKLGGKPESIGKVRALRERLLEEVPHG